MYEPGEMYSAVANYVANHKPGLTRTIAAGLVAVVAGCATPQKPLVPLPPNTPNSIVLADGERVCDVAGEWNAIYNNFGYGTNRDIVKITQTGADFVGVKTIGNRYVRAGSETVRGEVGEGGIKQASSYDTDEGWIPSDASIGPDCDNLRFTGRFTDIILNRK